jgi:glucose-1-phosphate thymidylyltransferase
VKALVLSGGKGTRLRPLTHTIAKQLIPVANRPILHYVMDQIARAKIHDVGIVISPETGDGVKRSLSGNPWKLNLTFIPQAEPLGLAHAVKVSRGFLKDDSFMMYLGDNLIGKDVREFLEHFERSGSDAVILLKEVEDARMFGVAEVDGSGNVVHLLEKPKDPPSNLALVGVYIFSRAIHPAIDEILPSARGELEITDAIQRLIDRGNPVQSYVLDDWWLDTGKKDTLLTANTLVLDRWTEGDLRSDVDPDSSIVGRVSIAEGVLVKRSTIRGPTVIGAGTRVSNCFIGPYTSIGNDCVLVDSSVEHSVILDRARIEGIERLEDSLIGTDAAVLSDPGGRKGLKLNIGDDSEVIV